MTEEEGWEQLAKALQAAREYNAEVIARAFDNTELHGTN